MFAVLIVFAVIGSRATCSCAGCATGCRRGPGRDVGPSTGVDTAVGGAGGASDARPQARRHRPGEGVPRQDARHGAGDRRRRTSRSPTRSSCASWARRAAASRRCSTSSPGSSTPTAGTVEIDGEPIIGPGPDRGHGVPDLHASTRGERSPRTSRSGSSAGTCRKAERRERVRRAARHRGAHQVRRPARPSSCRAACASGSRSRARSRPSPTCCCSTSRSARSTRRPGASMQDFLLTVWRRTGSTILFVTHDIDEAIYLGAARRRARARTRAG